MRECLCVSVCVYVSMSVSIIVSVSVCLCLDIAAQFASLALYRPLPPLSPFPLDPATCPMCCCTAGWKRACANAAWHQVCPCPRCVAWSRGAVGGAAQRCRECQRDHTACENRSVHAHTHTHTHTDTHTDTHTHRHTHTQFYIYRLMISG